jgi:hypothetical protein
MYNKLLNNNNTIMLIMALIIIALLFYIIKISRKVNEGFAPSLSSFGGVVFSGDEAATTKTLNITGDVVTRGAITADSITIGEAKLTYENGRLVINKGLNATDIESKSSVLGKDIRASEFLSADKIRAFTGDQRVAFRDQAFIPNLYTRNIRGQSGGAYEMVGGDLYLQAHGTL